ncbi:hypothetical protein MULP_03587 [Mycobacterium liflandii 128FXT]|uniref:Alpha/beta hydrolase n=2 Tax=Mycobacterium liflandii TaxID=261524 RepID=L7VAQ0_MYCL1|nr:hypothetical protein MULP_03587 [Mycobacterium liflandii 128FXT]
MCRAGALSSLLQEATAEMSELTAEQRALGFSDSILERGGRGWCEVDPFDGQTDFSISPDEDLDESRVRRWLDLNETADPRRAVGFLIAMLGSSLERESTAAAAALWHGLGLQNRRWPPPGPPRWRIFERLAFDLDDVLPDAPWGPWFWRRDQGPSLIDEEYPTETISWEPTAWRDLYLRLAFRLRGDRYIDPFIVSILVRGRLDTAIGSPDPITRSLAFAALEPFDAGEGGYPPRPPELPPTPPGGLAVSTMIHGTWGWKGDWWRPGGTFHQFILGSHRPNLYARGAKFSWSGAYSAKHRSLAARDFQDWANDVAPHGLQSVFGHSYGGEVAARAACAGTPIHELVLLSTPVTNEVARTVKPDMRIIDVRLRFDPVLAIAGARQRLPKHSKAVEILLDKWRLDHGATHSEHVWRAEDIARRAGI